MKHAKILLSRKEIKQLIQESDELSDLVKIIKKGWPEKIEEVKDSLKRFWYFRETLSVYDDMIFKNDRVFVPKTMVPLVLKNCHLAHKGVQSTLQLARDNVFWPEMKNDITNYVKTCKPCNKIQNDNQEEPIWKQNAPERAWNVVASDLFHLKGKDYILIADGFSGYFDFKELTNITSNSVINALKSWFAIFGIPDVLRSDGGKQYHCTEFKKFSTDWNFEHSMSSPHFPRSNGLAERYVQEAKQLLKKCIEDNTDIQLALLHHRNTPRLDLGSPCQRLMNKRTKTLLPTNNRLLTPKIIKKVTNTLNKIKEKEKEQADKGKKEMRKYEIGENVLLRLKHQHWIPAKIVSPAEGPRSYIVETEGVKYCRNSWHIKPAFSAETSSSDDEYCLFTGPDADPNEIHPVAKADNVPATQVPMGDQRQTISQASSPSQTRTRSGRLIKKPQRYF